MCMKINRCVAMSQSDLKMPNLYLTSKLILRESNAQRMYLVGNVHNCTRCSNIVT